MRLQAPDAPYRWPTGPTPAKVLRIENKFRAAQVSLYGGIACSALCAPRPIGIGSTSMLIMSRRSLLASAAVAAAFGLHDKRLAFVDTAYAQAPLEPTNGVYKYKVGSIEVSAIY